MKFYRETNFVNKNTGLRLQEKRKTVLASARSFGRDIFNMSILTPHEEMEKIMSMKRHNTILQSAINTSVDFIMGKEFLFESKDILSKKEVEKWWDDCKLNWVARTAVESCVGLGNAYIEQDFMESELHKGLLIPEKYYNVPDASMMYINSDPFGQPLKKKVNINGKQILKDDLSSFYIQKIPQTLRVEGAKYFQLSYYGSSKFSNLLTQIYGLPVDRRKLIHIKLNLGETGLYGRSPIASAINDAEMLYELERCIAVLAKYKAVPRKIWSLGDKDMPADEDDIDDFIAYLESLDKEDDAWINKPVNAIDVSYAGKEMNLEYALSHIKKKMISGVSLDFLSGMADDVNRATASQELLAYILSIYSKRKIFLEIFQDMVDKFTQWKGLRRVLIKFDDLDFETKREKEDRIRANWTSNMCTYNEMREGLGLPTVDDGKGDKLFGELQVDFQSAFLGSADSFTGGENNSFQDSSNGMTQFNNEIEKYKNIKVPENFDINMDIKMTDPKVKRIDYKTLHKDFNFIFEEHISTEIYYKEYDEMWEVTFPWNNIIVTCLVTINDLLEFYSLNNPSEEQIQQVVNEFKNKVLKNAIKEI